MTNTVKRKAITAQMKLETLRLAKALVPCSECLREALAKETDPKVVPLWLVAHPLEQIQFDHHLALVDGGEHSAANLRPLCAMHHRIKSAREHKENCRAKRRAKKHSGQWKAKKPMGPSRGFDKTLKKRFDGKVVPRV